MQEQNSPVVITQICKLQVGRYTPNYRVALGGCVTHSICSGVSSFFPDITRYVAARNTVLLGDKLAFIIDSSASLEGPFRPPCQTPHFYGSCLREKR